MYKQWIFQYILPKANDWQSAWKYAKYEFLKCKGHAN